ncbi:unnamed protein product [Phytomonas sp. EM1]|nr:unnamed protein product [Phytomonas sp. EM1]|eukprot:CCW60735.1 unnamed protein product [Phytomonas sp. isolate EM1]
MGRWRRTSSRARGRSRGRMGRSSPSRWAPSRRFPFPPTRMAARRAISSGSSLGCSTRSSSTAARARCGSCGINSRRTSPIAAWSSTRRRIRRRSASPSWWSGARR